MAKVIKSVSVPIQQNCGCPPEYIDVGNGICQKTESVTPTPPSQPISIVPITPNGAYILYGAIIYEDITLKQWPILGSPQGGLNWTLAANTIIPSSGVSNPYLPGGAPYTSLNPGTDGVNYTGGIGTNGEHAKVILPAPAGWPGIPVTGTPYNGSPLVALRESTITGGVLNYGIGAGVFPQQQLVSPSWVGGGTNWLDQRGIRPEDCEGANRCSNSLADDCYKCSKWYGFTHCVTINTTKTYYVAAAANNAFRFKMNGILVMEFNLADGMEPTLDTLSIFPITLPAGTHVFQVDMLNYSGDGGMGFEIYDCSLAQLQGVGSLAELSNYTVFSAKDRVGGTFDVSSYAEQGYTCPPGYVYSACNGTPSCVKITTTDPAPFNVKLTPCCGDTSKVYIVPHDQFLASPILPGWTACIEDIDPTIGCWLTEETCEAVTYAGPFTVLGTFADCFKCLAECKPCEDSCKSCPPGYAMRPDGTCEGLESVPATQNPTTYIAGLGSWGYGIYGANAGQFYEDITLKPWPIKAVNGPCSTLPAGTCSILQDNTSLPLIVTNEVANPVWGGDGGAITNYRLKVSGLWTTVAPLPINEWIGFAYCVTLTQSKTYFIAFAVDDIAKIYLDGVLMIDHSSVGWSFRTWKIIPVTLTAGTHIIDGRVLNSGSVATFGFEIYDATLAQLLAVAAPGDLDPYIVFSTADYIGQAWQTGENSGYSCPDGYSLNTCDGIVCSRIVTVPAIDCCVAIKDCTTNEEVYLVTPGDNSHGLPDIKTLVGNGTIGKLCLNTGCVEGCFYVEETESSCVTAIPYENVVSFTQYLDCPTCYKKCYLLTNCLDSEETMVTNTDLSQYLNYVIAIKGCKDKCWIVTEADNCENCSGPVIILKACPPLGVVQQKCQFTLPIINEDNPLIRVTATIDGVEYTIENVDGLLQVLQGLNDLNLGVWSPATIGGTNYITVIGTHNYTSFCTTTYFGQNEVTVCSESVCSDIESLSNCTYDFTDAHFEDDCYWKMFWVVDGTPIPLTPLPTNVQEIADAINALGFGTATVSGNTLVLEGAYTYESIALMMNSPMCEVRPPNQVFTPTCIVVPIPGGPDCACCLPKPEVVVKPLLNPRPVDPGYTTPGCSPEYTEKVNCAFGDVMNKKMLSARYGLTTCCEDPDTDWEIKKELLDFEAIKDTNLTPCNNEL